MSMCERGNLSQSHVRSLHIAGSSTVVAPLCPILVTIIGSTYTATIAIVAPAFDARVIAVAAISARLIVCTAGKEECYCSQEKGGA
jgi:hypothetical protein